MQVKSVTYFHFSEKFLPKQMHFCHHSRNVKIPLWYNSISAAH